MQKLLLVSVLVATVAIPAWAARDPHPKRALKRTLVFLFAFNVLYVLALRFIYPRL